MAHPLEIALLVVALACTAANLFLLLLKHRDLQAMKRERRNGPMLFMKRDNVRHQFFMLLVALGMVTIAAIGATDATPVIAQTKRYLGILIAGGLLALLDAYFVYRRRWRMAELIAKYDIVPGGRREYDPPVVAVPVITLGDTDA
jgi:hypothetical protein